MEQRKRTRWSRPGDMPIFYKILLGVVVAWGVAEIKPAELPPAPLVVFLSGAIAICAMILPGISGSFILLLLGRRTFYIIAFTISIIPFWCRIGLSRDE